MAVPIVIPLIKAAVGFGASFIDGQKRLKEQREAQESYDQALDAFSQQDITNPFEDLTVNTQAAEFAAEQQQQGLADTLAATRQAAGGSGIAALAQSLANVQAQNIQKASADIGRQEARNQQLAARGELIRQDRESDLRATQLGMEQQRLAQANEARQEAKEARLKALGGVAGALAGGVGNIIEDTNFFTGKT
tara:strand:- start:547 stop:1125 length:579 start_codon:yes stop_codon:yes gene_type:complete